MALYTMWRMGFSEYNVQKEYPSGRLYIGKPSPCTSRTESKYPSPAQEASKAKRKRPPAKDLIWSPTALEKTRTTVSAQPFVHHYRTQNFRSGSDVDYYTTSARFYASHDPTFSYIDRDPMNKLINKLRAEVTNFGTMLGEYKQTSSMFQDLGKQLLKSMVRASHRDIKGALRELDPTLLKRAKKKATFREDRRLDYLGDQGRRWSKKAANGWLLYHFGIECLVRDMASSARELRERLMPKDSHPIIRSSVKEKITRRVAPRRTYGDPYADGVSVTYDELVTKRLVCHVEINSDEIRSLSDHGLLNPLSIAWELTTLSWAVDYFIGIGEWLQALDMPYYIRRSVCVQMDQVVHMNAKLIPSTWKPGCSASAPPAMYITCRHYKRSLRTLGAVRPQWNPSLSTPRIASLTALIRQKLK